MITARLLLVVDVVCNTFGLCFENDTAVAAAASERAATSMLELRDHFASCFQPPKEAAGSRVTFYFSLDIRGQVIARPRTVWFGFKGTADEKSRGIASFETSFKQCLPLKMDSKLSASIPGKVYFLQYAVATSGQRSEVLLRPFGTHGGGSGGGQSSPDSSPGFVDPNVDPVRLPAHPAWMVRPFPARRPFRQFFVVGPRAAGRAR